MQCIVTVCVRMHCWHRQLLMQWCNAVRSVSCSESIQKSGGRPTSFWCLQSLRSFLAGTGTRASTQMGASVHVVFFPPKSDDLFSYHLVTTPTLSAFQRRFSTVLCNFNRKKIIPPGCHPWWCYPKRSDLASALVTPLLWISAVVFSGCVFPILTAL